MLVIAIIFALILRVLIKIFPKVKTVYEFVNRKLFFNTIIRSLMEAYLKLCLSSFISI